MRWTVATVALLAIMGLAAYFVFNRAVEGGGYVVVPDATGLSVTQAASIFAQEGLELGEQQQVVNDRVPEYHVILQRPEANRVIRQGRKISLTISEGRQTEPAPELVGMLLAPAMERLNATRLVVGTTARLPHPSPRDTVLGQDPEPGTATVFGGEINLLLSDGEAQPLFMPEIFRMSLEEAQLELAKLGLSAVPYKTNKEGDDYEVILNQTPAPGTLLRAGDEVSFEVRLLPTTFLPNARRKVELSYIVPDVQPNPEIRVEVIDHANKRETVYPLFEHYVRGRPPRHIPGSNVRMPVVYTTEITVEFYTNGLLHKSYYYEGDNAPVETVNPAFGLQSRGGVQQEDLDPAPVSPRRFRNRR